MKNREIARTIIDYHDELEARVHVHCPTPQEALLHLAARLGLTARPGILRKFAAGYGPIAFPERDINNVILDDHELCESSTTKKPPSLRFERSSSDATLRGITMSPSNSTGISTCSSPKPIRLQRLRRVISGLRTRWFRAST